MAKTLAVEVGLTHSGAFVDADDLNSKRGTLRYDFSDSLADGDGVDEADLQWYDTRSLTGAETLDLAGILLDAFGDAVDLAKVRGIIIENTSTVSGEKLTVGNAAANTWVGPFGAAAHTLDIEPGGVLWLWSPVDGYAVTAGTGDQLKIDAGAATITYRIIIVGIAVAAASGSGSGS